MSTSPIKVFITGAANGLAEVREGLADHPDVELVGTAADPAKAGAKLAESSAQVILHGTTATDHVPTGEIEAIRGVTAAPIVLVTSASANAILSEALAAGIFDVVLLPQLTDGIVFTIKKANSLAAGRGSSSTSKGASTIDGKTVTLDIAGALNVIDMGAVADAAINGVGIAYLPHFMAADHVATGKLKMLLVDNIYVGESIYMVYLRRRHASPRLRVFLDFLRDVLSDGSADVQRERAPVKVKSFS